MDPDYDLYESHQSEAKSFASKRHEPYEDQPVELDRSYAPNSSRKGSMTGSTGKGAGINIIGYNRQYQQQAQDAGVANSMSSLSSSANSSNFFINSSAGLKNNSNVASRAVPGTNSYSNSKHSSISTPQDSRRPSGNSITIKITNENAVNVHDEPISLMLTHNDFETLNEELRSYDNRVDEEPEEQTSGEQDENEQEEFGDLDETESATSRSNEHLMRKKLKDKRKLVRSIAQQQHHLLLNQESEDRVDDERTQDEHTYYKHNKREPIENEAEPSSTMNSAFDELFAAAESGNSTRLAAIEAKMATEAAAATAVDESLGDNIPFGKNSTKTRSRNSSFRSKHSGGSVKFSNSNANSPSSTTNNNNNLTIEDNYLGSPQQLTRSVSCKRPGSFKRMRSKASSPNRQLNQATSQSMKSGHGVRPTSPYIQGRRGTHGSISLMDANVHGESRAESLPFENFDENSHQQEGDTEIYRVRQFNTTNKGLVINRGDSFKRSFKKSSQSISSNKQPTPPHSYHDTNTLALPSNGDYSMKRSRHNVNHEANEIQLENGSNADSDEHIGQNVIISVFPQAPVHDENIQTFVVHLLGASSVGKSALIKQFHTSEYRGIYDINAQQSTDEESLEPVPVMLDGVESRLQFIPYDVDTMRPEVPSGLHDTMQETDAFILVYSILDKSTFQIVIDLLKFIRVTERRTNPIIIVGNKSDLVRKRSISREDGRNLAIKYSCKFVETSVAINDKVDDLLAGILKQIRLSEATYKQQQAESNTNHLAVGDKKSSGKKLSSGSYLASKTSTLTRKLFKNRKEKHHGVHVTSHSGHNSSTLQSTASSYSPSNTSSSGNVSFLHKLFNTIFRKKAARSTRAQSVENLFSPTPSLAQAQSQTASSSYSNIGLKLQKA